MLKTTTLLISILVLCTMCNNPQKEINLTKGISPQQTLFIGTYTRKEGHVDGKAEGIYKVSFDPQAGKLSNTQTIAKIINPSFVTVTKDQKYLFSTSELAQDNERTGFIESLKTREEGMANPISKLPTGGRAPCHVELDLKEKLLFAVNYLDGIINVFSINENGELVESDRKIIQGKSIHQRQQGPHAHSINIAPDNSKVYVPDLGTDKVWIFDIDHQNGKLLASQPPFLSTEPGAGPRHMDLSYDGQYLYIINELNSTIEIFKKEMGSPDYKKIQIITTLPSEYEGVNSCADIHLHPSGKFLYGSNRGHNSIVGYRVQEDGTLTFLSHTPTLGDTPRNFNISTDGKFLMIANQDSDNIVVYAINATSGSLSELSDNYSIPTPVCIKF